MNCNICFNRYTNREDLIEHQVIEHGIVTELETHKCDICFKSFWQKKELEKHKLQKHADIHSLLDVDNFVDFMNAIETEVVHDFLNNNFKNNEKVNKKSIKIQDEIELCIQKGITACKCLKQKCETCKYSEYLVKGPKRNQSVCIVCRKVLLKRMIISRHFSGKEHVNNMENYSLIINKICTKVSLDILNSFKGPAAAAAALF